MKFEARQWEKREKNCSMSLGMIRPKKIFTVGEMPLEKFYLWFLINSKSKRNDTSLISVLTEVLLFKVN